MTAQVDIRALGAAVQRLEQLDKAACFDPVTPTSRPTASQEEVLRDIGVVEHRYVLGGNQSGKTQLGAREASWVLTETHPFWTRPEKWGTEPLQLIVVSRTTQQFEEVIWRKLSQFLTPNEYTVHRQGGVIKKITHLPTGNTLLAMSHHADNEAREKSQAFVAHYCWLDELPSSYRMIEELHRRVMAKGGPFLATFTPKTYNQEIKKMVDAARPPFARKYTLRMFDNPVYSEQQRISINESLRTMSEAYRNTILAGDWAPGEEQVYHFHYDSMVREPSGYEPTWRHVESVDPALSSALGLTVWAEDPRDSAWYCIRSDYVRGIATPTTLVGEIRERTRSYNVVRRIADPHEVWYIQTANSMGIRPGYIGVHKKNERKGELIKGLQEKMGVRIYIAPWCEPLVSEIEDCRWAEGGQVKKIVNASSYHLLDSAQYFADNIPAAENRRTASNWDSWLYQENEKRKKQEMARQQATGNRIQKRGRRW